MKFHVFNALARQMALEPGAVRIAAVLPGIAGGPAR